MITEEAEAKFCPIIKDKCITHRCMGWRWVGVLIHGDGREEQHGQCDLIQFPFGAGPFNEEAEH